MSRVPILLLFTVSTMSALGHAQSSTRTSQPPSLGLSRIDALNGSVVAADFNGDGIIDLAASGVTASGSTTAVVPPVSTVTSANQASVPGVAAGTPSVAVFGNSVSIPNAPASGGTNTTSASGLATTSSIGVPLPGNNVAVFGNGATTPNIGVSFAPGGAGTAAAQIPATSNLATQPTVAVFGNGVSVPNSNNVPVPANAFVRGSATPGMPTSAPTAGGAVQPSVASTTYAASAAGTPVGSTAATDTAAAAAPVGTVATTDNTAAGAGTPVGTTAATTQATTAANEAVTNVNTPVNTVAVATNTQTSGFDASTHPSASGPVVVMLGVGNGTFRAPIQSWMSGMVLAAGDFNRDRKTDLVVLQPDNQVIVMQGKGDGTFTAAFPAGFPVAAQAGQPNDVTFAIAGDVDGDGRLDLIVGANPNSARFFPGLGNFTFGTSVDLVTAESPNNAVIADINGDGRNDIIVASRTGQALSLFLNQGASLFTASDMPLDRQATDVAAADLNRDGKIDLIVAAAGGGVASSGVAAAGGNAASVSAAAPGGNGPASFADGFVYVLLGRGDGTFAQPAQYAVSPGTWRVALGDFNRDGTLDVATANRSASADAAAPNGSASSDSVSVLQGNADGTFAAASTIALASNANPSDARFRGSVRSLTMTDVNGDQAPDLVVSGGAILVSRALK